MPLQRELHKAAGRVWDWGYSGSVRRLCWTLMCLALPVLACGDSGSDSESSATETSPTGDSDPTGDGDGDPTGDGDGAPTGDGDGDDLVECASVDDCQLVNDCCSCGAVLNGQAPACEVPSCDQPSCEAEFGVSDLGAAACFMGSCVLERLSCDLNDALCDAPPPPACENGRVRSVVDDCYGPCVQPNMCATLPMECDADTCGEGFACMISQSGAPSRCVPISDGCAEPNCACVSAWLDEACGGSCSDAGGTLLCEDGG